MSTYDEDFIASLEARARRVRRHIIDSIYSAGSGHPGGSLSAADIITALYTAVMKHDPENCCWDKRDWFVLSKGHAAPALYATLAECGYFDVEELKTLRKLESRLQGHPDMLKCPGVEVSTGSLGQGLSMACGIALAMNLDRQQNKVYCLMGDGEMNSGQIWEAGMFATHYKLGNLIGIIDRNGLQIDGATEQIMGIEPLAFRWKSFGWHIIEINGHSMRQILDAVERSKEISGKPTMIIAHTIKGKGVSFMEGSLKYHGKSPNDAEYQLAISELEEGA